jgi:mono/diheme cytochrome c family protein
MQVKIVIGTVAFMMTMIILGFAALQEPTRLEEFTHAREGRSIENGANIFANNCSTCHGEEGLAQTGCTHPETGEAVCVGLPLKNYFLLCGDPPERLDDLRWVGTVDQYVVRTVAAGRSGTFMPAWSSQFGGPMRGDQVADVAAYVVNWGDPNFCANVPTLFPWPDAVEDLFVMDITEPVEFTAASADAANGEAVYNQVYGCVGCHGQIDVPGSNLVGPWLGDIAEVGATRIEGYSAAQYVYESIRDPNAFLAPECPGGVACSPGLMPQDFEFRMGNNSQDMIDLLAYLVGE